MRSSSLDAARTEFAQRGFDATTVRDIADAAGAKASNLYRYIESKDSMIREILGKLSQPQLCANSSRARADRAAQLRGRRPVGAITERPARPAGPT